jgi:putative phosphoribosyl transferase
MKCKNFKRVAVCHYHQKLPHPLHEELAIGALAEDGSTFLSPLCKASTDTTLNRIVRTQRKEIESRIKSFRQGNALPDMKDKHLILVDDGIATGSTVVPVIMLCKNYQAATLTVASPVSGPKEVSEISSLADHIIVLERPE